MEIGWPIVALGYAAQRFARGKRAIIKPGNETIMNRKVRSQTVADLVPAEESRNSDAMIAVDEMLFFMQTRKPVRGVDIKALINEGRA